MTKFSHLVIILPCHSLEDFPSHYTGKDAENLLACWTSLWHPSLLAATKSMPQWMSADYGEPCWKESDHWDHPEESTVENETDSEKHPLVVLPTVAESICTSEIMMAAESDGLLVCEFADRSEVVQQAARECQTIADSLANVDQGTVNDFFALGYAYLQVQLMTRQLRYSSNLDDHQFQTSLIEAAEAAVKQSSNAEDLLMVCYDMLLEEKNVYYPVEPQLCDVVLIGDTTLGKSLTSELENSLKATNFLMTGHVAKTLVNKHPQKAETIRNLIDSGFASIVGGHFSNAPDWLMDRNGIVRQFERGRREFESAFGVRPRVFMRQSSGVSPDLPGILNRFEYIGAVHCPVDRRGVPMTTTGVIRWEGSDDESILTLGDRPTSAAESGNFLGIGVRIGEMIDSAHSANLILARWPARTCQAYDDFRRVAEINGLLGSFSTFEQVFESAYDPGYGERYSADEYRTNYLKQAIQEQQSDPISRVVEFHQQHARLDSIRRLIALNSDREMEAEWLSQLSSIEEEIDQSIVNGSIADTRQRLEMLWSQFADGVGEQTRNENAAFEPKKTVFNLHSGKQVKYFHFTAASKSRIGFFRGESESGPFAQQTADGCDWVVEIPAMGSVELDSSQVTTTNPFKRNPPLASDHRLQNEFLIANVDPNTGGIRSVGFHHQRINLLTQKLGFRIPSNDGESRSPSRYATMVADSCTVLKSTPLVGSIQSAGRLLDNDDSEVAEFKQTMTVYRGIARIGLAIEITPKIPFSENMNHYVCSRVAWKEESSTVVANAIDSKQHVTGEWFHATRYISVGDENSFTLLTNGLPYHRRAARNMLDSVLMIKGETQNKFWLDIDINQRYPMAAAVENLLSELVVSNSNEQNHLSKKWHFHLSVKNVIVTRCDVIRENDNQNEPVIRLVLLETEGRQAALKIRSRRSLMSAERVCLSGRPVTQLDIVDSNQVQLDLPPSGQEFIQFRFRA